MPDTEISMLDHCTGEQLKELLALASPSAKITLDWLVEAGDPGQLEHLLTDMCSGSGQSGGALVQTVCSTDTPVEVLIATKRIAKHLAVAAEGPAQNAAATLLYHLSVASALAYHECNISSKDPAERLPLYKDLAAELPDDELAAVFEKALARLPSGV